MKDLNIAVVGGDIAALAAALTLGRAGHRVTLFEGGARPEAPPGELITPTGLSALHELQLATPLLTVGALVTAVTARQGGKRRLFEFTFAEQPGEWFALGVPQGSVRAQLDGAVGAQAEITRVPTSITAADQTRADVTRLRDATGGTHGPFDAIAVADGADSALRRTTTLVLSETPAAWGFAWFVGVGEATLFASSVQKIFDGGGRALLLYPIGPVPDQPDKTYVAVGWAVATEAYEAWRRSSAAAWRGEVEKLAPHLAATVQTVAPSDTIFEAVPDVRLRRAYSGRMVFVGPAAHPMPPLLFTEPAFSLMEARGLAQAITAETTVPRAFAAHERERGPQRVFYHQAAWLAASALRPQKDWMGKLRDALAGPVTATGYTRKLLIETYAGVRVSPTKSTALTGAVFKDHAWRSLERLRAEAGMGLRTVSDAPSATTPAGPAEAEPTGTPQTQAP